MTTPTEAELDALIGWLRHSGVYDYARQTQAADAIAALREQVAAITGYETEREEQYELAVHAITGYEGEDDALTVLHQLPGILEGMTVVQMVDERDRISGLHADAMRLVEKAEADNAALRQDAERYRWLREQAGTISPKASTLFFLRGNWANVFNGEFLDAHIDAAMREGKE